VVLEYNWIKDAPQTAILLSGNASVTIRYNLIEDSGWVPGTHAPTLALAGGSFEAPLISFNTFVQHETLSGGEGLLITAAGTGSIANAETVNNTLIASPSPDGMLVQSFMIHAGSDAAAPAPATGAVHDTFIDARGALAPFYLAAAGFTHTHNIDMATGSEIGVPADNNKDKGLAMTSTASATVNGACGAANGTAHLPRPTGGLCSAGTVSGMTGTGPWSWSCVGKNGGTTASCSDIKVNGKCGPAKGVHTYTSPSSGLCNAGNASSVSLASNLYTWSCAGINTGTTAACKAPAKIDGACGAANGVQVPTKPTSGLCTAGKNSAVSKTKTTWKWTCAAVNGGIKATCSAPIGAVISSIPINGQCGSSNGTTVSSIPTANLCNVGVASSIAGSGPWSWTCAGSHGGTTASCSANKTSSPPPVNGACGSANGTTVSTKPSTNLCTTGSATTVSGAGPWTWSCTGANGGTTASCSANKTATATNGACGSANGTTVSTAPTTNLCTTGSATTVSGSGPWTWSCTGANGGTSASCSANKTATPTNGTCGSANGTTVSTAPTTNLCSTGSASSVTGTGPWSWSCTGANGGTTASCSANKTGATVVNGACGSANGTTASSAPVANFCNAGTASSVSGSGPWSWTCTGSGGGTTASCSVSKTTTGSTSIPTTAASWANITGNLAGMASECGNSTMISAVPNSSAIISGIAQHGLWKSTVDGTWTQLGTGAGSDTITNRPITILYDPTNSSIFWEAGIYNSIARNVSPWPKLCSSS
jgi:hypothetical protein